MRYFIWHFFRKLRKLAFANHINNKIIITNRNVFLCGWEGLWNIVFSLKHLLSTQKRGKFTLQREIHVYNQCYYILLSKICCNMFLMFSQTNICLYPTSKFFQSLSKQCENSLSLAHFIMRIISFEFRPCSG